MAPSARTWNYSLNSSSVDLQSDSSLVTCDFVSQLALRKRARGRRCVEAIVPGHGLSGCGPAVGFPAQTAVRCPREAVARPATSASRGPPPGSPGRCSRPPRAARRVVLVPKRYDALAAIALAPVTRSLLLARENNGELHASAAVASRLKRSRRERCCFDARGLAAFVGPLSVAETTGPLGPKSNIGCVNSPEDPQTGAVSCRSRVSVCARPSRVLAGRLGQRWSATRSRGATALQPCAITRLRSVVRQPVEGGGLRPVRDRAAESMRHVCE